MSIDLHNHVIPGVDDGARTPADGRAAVAALAEQGVRRIVATPHLDGSLTGDAAALDARLAELDVGWARLREALDAEPVMAGGEPDPAAEVTLHRAAEVKLDAPEVDLSDPRLRLAGSRAVLVEFAYLTVPLRSAEVLRGIVDAGWQPLLAHPERYHGVDGELKVVRRWLDAGAYLQVNAGSLLGRHGDAPRRVAERLLAGGWVHIVASDYHARGEPDTGAVRALLESWEGEEQARTLFEANPARLLDDRPCIPVTPVAPPNSIARRLRRWLRR